MTVLDHAIERVRGARAERITGTVGAMRGLSLLVDDLPVPVGATVHISAHAGRVPGEVVGFDGGRAIVMTLGATSGIRSGDRVVSAELTPSVDVCPGLLGRVLDGMGRPIDGNGPLRETVAQPLLGAPITAMSREPIRTALSTGVRAIDAFMPVGKGQRVGIFAGPGVGKSTLLGMIARSTRADVNVIALIGERGREVREFIEGSLGDEGLRRSVVIVATSDESPLLRVRAAHAACAVAQYFAGAGLDVMLMLDSVTRFAHAQRQIGLAVGEPPATRGYTPSVFAALPVLLERAGAMGTGSVTGFYTTLVEGDDMTEPVADAVRGILDGHIALSRELAQRGHFPAIDVLDSVSRVATEVTSRERYEHMMTLRRLLGAYTEVEELVQIGAYAHGSNPAADAAIRLKPQLDRLVQQSSDESSPMEQTLETVAMLASQARALSAHAPGGGRRGDG
ncbi:MAG: FliI/YscN family ATPase [Phycisphaerales bacterium]